MGAGGCAPALALVASGRPPAAGVILGALRKRRFLVLGRLVLGGSLGGRSRMADQQSTQRCAGWCSLDGAGPGVRPRSAPVWPAAAPPGSRVLRHRDRDREGGRKRLERHRIPKRVLRHHRKSGIVFMAIAWAPVTSPPAAPLELAKASSHSLLPSGGTIALGRRLA